MCISESNSDQSKNTSHIVEGLFGCLVFGANIRTSKPSTMWLFLCTKYGISIMYLKSRHFQWTEIIIDSELKSLSKYLCLYLATFMNSKTDMAYPGLKRIEHETGLTKKTVIKYLGLAEESEYLIIKRGDSSSTNEYFCSFPNKIKSMIKSGNLGSVGRTPPNDGVVELRGGGGVSQVIRVVEDIHLNKQVNKQVNKQYSGKKVRYRFTPPTTNQVVNYAKEKDITIDAEDFCDFYTSKGWMVGKNKMKCWKSAASRWARKNKGTGNGKSNRENKFSVGQFLADQAKEIFDEREGKRDIRDIN